MGKHIIAWFESRVYMLCVVWFIYSTRADSRLAPRQWETVLLSIDASHWLGASLESALCTCVFLAVCSIVIICHQTFRLANPCALWCGKFSQILRILKRKSVIKADCTMLNATHEPPTGWYTACDAYYCHWLALVREAWIRYQTRPDSWYIKWY